MNIETIQAPRGAIAVLSGGKVQITDAGAALDLAMSVRYETGASRLAIDKRLVCSDFFILSTGVAGLGAGVDQLILTLFPGVAAHHQHIEEALHPGFLFPLAVDVLRADAVGDHVEPGGVAVLAELVRNHIAGAVDVGEPVEERIPEAVVYKVVDAPAVAHVQGEGDVLRLAVEGRRVRDAQLFHMLQAHDAQGRRHHEMHHVRPGRRLFKHMAVGDGQPHPLAGDEMLHHWKEPHLPHGVLVVRGLAGGDDPHLVAVVLQRLGKTPCADGGAVVRVVKLVDDQNDLHKRLNRLSLVWRRFRR